MDDEAKKVDTDKVAQAMREVDRSFGPHLVRSKEPASLVSWLRLLAEKQEETNKRLERIERFLGAST
jgi:hypothetical protein